MKNPNGYGSVVKLSGNRRNPYWVRKTKGWNEKGHPIYDTIGYTATREEGNILLANYNSNPWNIDKANVTLQELFDLWLEKKAPKLGKGNYNSLKSSYKHIKQHAKMKYREIKAYHMQDCIDNCNRGYSTQAAIKNLWNHLDRFALEIDIPSKNYASLLTSDPIPFTSRMPFSDEEIKRIWKAYDEQEDIPYIEWVDVILIFLYSGFRISELLGMKTVDVDIVNLTFKGGVKTKSGKNRIVPVHSRIIEIVKSRYNEESEFFISRNKKRVTDPTFRKYWSSLMSSLGIEKTTHETRHTFETILDSNGANRRCIDLMMGHVSKDVGNRVYNHKTIEELRAAIELIP